MEKWENKDTLTQDVDLNSGALSNSMVLQINESWSGHLNGTKDGNNFKNVIIDTWSQENIIFFGASPKVDTTHETMNETPVK